MLVCVFCFKEILSFLNWSGEVLIYFLFVFMPKSDFLSIIASAFLAKSVLSLICVLYTPKSFSSETRKKLLFSSLSLTHTHTYSQLNKNSPVSLHSAPLP